MRLKTLTLTGAAAADTNAFVAAQAPAAGVPLTLEAAAQSISPARELTLTSAGDLSAINFTIVGRDRWANPLTEVIVGPNVNTVRSRSIFSAIDSITPDGTNAGTVEVGFPARVCSAWQIAGQRYRGDLVPTAQLQAAEVAGEAFGACSVEITNENVLRIAGEGADAAEIADPLAAAGDVVLAQGAFVRVVMTAVTGAARVHLARPGV